MSAIINIMSPCCAPPGQVTQQALDTAIQGVSDQIAQLPISEDSNSVTVFSGLTESNNGKPIDIKPASGSGGGSQGGVVRIWAAEPSGGPQVTTFVASAFANESLKPLKLPSINSAFELTTLDDGHIAYDPAVGLIISSSGSWVAV